MERKLTVELDADPSGIERGTAKGAKLLGDLARSAVVSGGLLASSIEKAATRGVDQILRFGNAIVTTTGKFEKYQAVLTNALGSKSLAQDSLKMLTEWAAVTPYSVQEATESFLKFVNRGLRPTKAELTNLGDLAASQGKSLDQLTEAVLDAQTGEFERLKEFGVRASKSGDQVTLSFKGVTQTVKATSGEISNAIIGFGKLSGVAGGMATVSQTVEGQISNLSDSFDRLLVALGESGVAGGFKMALAAGQQLIGLATDLIKTSPADQYRKEKSELNSLVGAVALANDNEAVRLTLIQQLNSKYPEFLGKLSAESVTTDILTTRLAAMNDQYERKIRIAVGEDKIIKKQQEYTRSIDAQGEALRRLAKAADKDPVQLENLTTAQKVALARQLAAKEPRVNLGMGQYGPGPMSALADFLQTNGEKLKTQQAELNRLLAENAGRQADLTKTTVAGYDTEIKQIREKIRLHQIERKEGLAEIKRLEDLKLIAQGKTPAMPNTPATSTGSKKTGPKPLDTGPMAVYKRYEESLVKEIEGLGANSPQLEKKQQQLESIRNVIADLQALTSKNKKIEIAGIKEITGPGTDQRAAKVVEAIMKLQQSTPELFTKTGVDKFLAELDGSKPTLDFYRNTIEKIRNGIAQMTLAGVKVDPKVLEQLKELKRLLAEAEGKAGDIEAKTNPGTEGADEEKWTKKAEARIAQMQATGQKITQSAKEMGQAMKAAHDELAYQSADILTGIGEGLAKGENPLKQALKSIVTMLGAFMIKIGTAMLVGGSLLTAAETALPFLKGLLGLDGPAAAIAGGALIVGGATVKGLASYEKGALFKGESVIRVGESSKALKGGGEWVSPIGEGARLITQEMNRMGAFATTSPDTGRLKPAQGNINIGLDGKFEIQGSTLLLAVSRALKSHNGFGGNMPSWTQGFNASQ